MMLNKYEPEWKRDADFAASALVDEIARASTMHHMGRCAVALRHVRLKEASIAREAALDEGPSETYSPEGAKP